MGEKYVTIKLPKNLVDEIDSFVGKHGFVSRSEVVKEALRRMFLQYNKEGAEAPLEGASVRGRVQ